MSQIELVGETCCIVLEGYSGVPIVSADDRSPSI